jgi:hypothetical protein
VVGVWNSQSKTRSLCEDDSGFLVPSSSMLEMGVANFLRFPRETQEGSAVRTLEFN